MFVDPNTLAEFNQPAPRYTSYPTAPEWGPLLPLTYAEKLEAHTDEPLSLYFHIPFCKTMCLYCACSVVLNRKPENESRYVDYLMREIDLVAAHLGSSRRAVQIHFGGGTPTKLSIPLFEKLFTKIASTFEIDFSKEVAIEIDPRTVLEESGAKLHMLKRLGFNRVSFGVQDTDPKVQEAIKRRQSVEMTRECYSLARDLGFNGVNIDLIYGLPHQTQESFRKTVSDILQLRPDRIAMFSYAKVPWLKKHQKAIREETLPTTETKFQIYAEARKAFIEGGYIAIGMDHFALEEDEIVTCLRDKTLGRNFQGYTAKLSKDMLGFGVTAIGSIQDTYVQNIKGLTDYYSAIDRGELPIHLGKVSTPDDLLRKWVIHTLMCTFELDKELFHSTFGTSFDTYFAPLAEKLEALESRGLIHQTSSRIVASELGELFIRLVAMPFDAYIRPEIDQFSRSV